MIKNVSYVGLLLLSLPVAAFAYTFDKDLYYGVAGESVKELQSFLTDQRLYSGPINGNFFALTREGVKNFQKRENISPALGFFGPKTRSRANNLLAQKNEGVAGSQEEQIISLRAKIAELMAKISALQNKPVPEVTTPSAPEPTPATSTTPVPETPAAPVLSGRITVSGMVIKDFSETEVNPFKIGDFTVNNGSSSDVLFANFEVQLTDQTESSLNRNRKVYFLLKDGTTAIDTTISSTELTFLLAHPTPENPHIYILTLPFDITMKSGVEKKFSLWVEQYRYVKSGTLRIKTLKVRSVNSPEIDGGFNFTLTRTPPIF